MKNAKVRSEQFYFFAEATSCKQLSINALHTEHGLRTSQKVIKNYSRIFCNVFMVRRVV